MILDYCPQCNSVKKWHFFEGEYAENPFDRFNKINPDEGWCEKCGFTYYEHCRHTVNEQIEEFRRTQTSQRGGE